MIKRLPDWAQGGIADAMEGGAWDGVEAAVGRGTVSAAANRCKAVLKGVFDKVVKE